MIIYNIASGQFVFQNKHSASLWLPNCLCYKQFDLAMMNRNEWKSSKKKKEKKERKLIFNLLIKQAMSLVTQLVEEFPTVHLGYAKQTLISVKRDHKY